MSEWWTYSLGSFLMFSPQVYYRLFESLNRAWWPLPLVALALGVLMLGLILLRHPQSGRIIALLMGGASLFVAWAYFAQRYADIHLAGQLFAATFALQGLLVWWLGARRARFMPGSGPAVAAGRVLLGVAVIGWPLLALNRDRGWQQAEVFALAPDPTAAAMLAVLLVCGGHWLLGLVPVLWLLFSAATLWSMGEPAALAPFGFLLAAIVALIAAAWFQRRRSEGTAGTTR